MQYGSRFDRCHWVGCRASCVDEIELCWYHFRLIGQTFIDKRSIYGADALTAAREHREMLRAQEPVDREAAKTEWWRKRSVVYYVRTGDYVKIGVTIHLRDRISSLRLERDALLAVEPGWREKEVERHQQFAAERQGRGRKENFNPSPRLLSHIDALRHLHGEPWSFTARRVTMAGPDPAVRSA